jgi:hypothetical protein
MESRRLHEDEPALIEPARRCEPAAAIDVVRAGKFARASYALDPLAYPPPPFWSKYPSTPYGSELVLISGIGICIRFAFAETGLLEWSLLPSVSELC